MPTARTGLRLPATLIAAFLLAIVAPATSFGAPHPAEVPVVQALATAIAAETPADASTTPADTSTTTAPGSTAPATPATSSPGGEDPTEAQSPMARFWALTTAGLLIAMVVTVWSVRRVRKARERELGAGADSSDRAQER